MEYLRVKTENRFYVYMHFRKSDGKPFYIGKGSGKRVDCQRKRSTYWKNTVAKHGLVTKILCKNMSEKLAFTMETKLIAFYSKKYELVNLTKGGDGPSGYKHTTESRARISQKGIGRVASAETRLKRSKALIGRPGHIPNAETRNKMRKAKLGKSLSEEAKAWLSKINKGKTFSAETRARISKAKGMPVRCVETGQVFASATEAAKIMKLQRPDICTVIKGNTNRKTVGGFHFEKVT